MPEPQKTIVEFRNLSRLYHLAGRDIYALDDINLSFLKGQFAAIIGKSGSGKTTLMNMVGGLDKPDIGEVLFADKDIGKMKSRDLAHYRNLSIGFVFQQFNLLNDLSALENVMLPLQYRRPKIGKIKMRAKEALARVGLADRIDHKPQELSGGQQQRVAIARALVTQPELLLADEPTGSLDSATSDDLLKLFTSLTADGLTIILITHDQDVANYATRRIKLHDGKVVEDRTTIDRS